MSLAATSLVGCATPEPVLRLKPLSESIVWREGRAADIRQLGRLRVATAFEREYQGHRHLVGFRVEIQNVANEVLVVDPARFYYAACNRSAGNAVRTCQPAHAAIDPEPVLLALDIEHARSEASAANRQTLATTLMFLDLAAATANTASGRHQDAAIALASATGAAAMGESVRATSAAESSAYEVARATWSSEALRKTTLHPGQVTAGLVFVDRVLSASEIVLVVRVEGETVSFPFQQTCFDARQRGRGTCPPTVR